MVDFNGTKIKIGSKIFFMQTLTQPVIGKVTEFES